MLPQKDIQEFKRAYEVYVSAFRAGELFTRRDFCDANALPYSTVVYNLETAVRHGALHRQKRLVGNQPTWVYGLPETLPKLKGF